MTITMTECDNMADALAEAEELGGMPIVYGNACWVVEPDDLIRMETAGATFAHITRHAGVLVTVPVNDR